MYKNGIDGFRENSYEKAEILDFAFSRNETR